VSNGPRIAIVHERFTEWGGSEQVVAELHAIWPDAPVFVPILDRTMLRSGLAEADVRSSALGRLYRGGSTYAYLLPLLPFAMKHLDLGKPDLVITSHHAFANRIVAKDPTRIISYVHSPARWMWDPEKRANEVGGKIGRAGLSAFASTQRRPDAAAAQRVDIILANSTAVAKRIEHWWSRTCLVVPPPVDVDYFTPDEHQHRENFFLLAGRLVPYKKPDVAIAAAQRAGVRLVVAGEGRMRTTLEAMAGAETEFLGAVSRPELRKLFRTCAALVFPGEEDFGIIPVEAQACGAAVIAARKGGVLDTVLPKKTGVLYDPVPDDISALAAELRSFDPVEFLPADSRRQAEDFSIQAFGTRIRQVVSSALDG
jgi:glycosyltransferase involved in cell wall biosynthesis